MKKIKDILSKNKKTYIDITAYVIREMLIQIAVIHTLYQLLIK